MQIHRQSGMSLAEQIRQEFRDRIRSNLMTQGTRLPSVRELSESLDVSLVTVVKAYALLERDGVVERIHGKGTYVRAKQEVAKPHPSVVERAFDWQLTLADYLPRAAMLGHRRSVPSPTLPYQMSMASLHPSISGSMVPAHMLAHFQADDFVYEYGPVEGSELLRRAIANDLEVAEIVCTAGDILVTNGVQQAIDLVARSFIGPRDLVVMEAPTYPGAIDIFRARGANIVSIPLDAEGMRLDLLIKQCDRTPPKLVYTMPTFQNPTGSVMSAKRRAQLLELAETYGFLILEDDSFSDCSYIESIPTAIRGLDHNGHVVYVKGYSKLYMAGCRIAALVASGSVRNRLVAAKSVSDLGSPTVTQGLILAFLRNAGKNGYLRKVVRALKHKRDLALGVLNREAPPGVTWTIPQGGLNIWMTLPDSINTDQLLIHALQMGITFLPGSACHNHETVNNQLRISFSYLDDEALCEGVTRLCKLLTQYIGNSSGGSRPLV